MLRLVHFVSGQHLEIGNAQHIAGVADNFQRALKAVDDMAEEVPEAMRGLLDGIAATQRDLLAA